MVTENPVVRDHMVPISNYPHLKKTETLGDAVAALLPYTCGETGGLRYADILVVDDNNEMVGRLNLQNILQTYDKHLAPTKGYEGKEGDFPNLTILWEDSFFSKCREKNQTAISACMVPPARPVKAGDSLLKALTIMLHNGEQALPVVEDKAIVGVIRLEEIFVALCGVCAR